MTTENNTRRFFLAAVLLTPALAWAQTACPPGMTAYGVGVCGPAAAPQEPQERPTRWISQHGAIAYDPERDVMGASARVSSQDKANDVAIADCKNGGGGECEIAYDYGNACVAVIKGKKDYHFTYAPTKTKAEATGLTACSQAGDSECHVHYSDCSLPYEVYLQD